MKRILLGSRFWLYFVAPQIVFAILALATTAKQILPLVSLVTFALSTGICVAFFPSVWVIFQKKGMVDRAEALTLGIFCTWFATALGGAWAAAWRYWGQPMWMVNNDFITYFRYLNICGAIWHMAAPGSITATIPAARWIKIGSIVAAAVVAFFVIGAALTSLGLPEHMEQVAQ